MGAVHKFSSMGMDCFMKSTPKITSSTLFFHVVDCYKGSNLSWLWHKKEFLGAGQNFFFVIKPDQIQLHSILFFIIMGPCYVNVLQLLMLMAGYTIYEHVITQQLISAIVIIQSACSLSS